MSLCVEICFIRTLFRDSIHQDTRASSTCAWRTGRSPNQKTTVFLCRTNKRKLHDIYHAWMASAPLALAGADYIHFCPEGDFVRIAFVSHRRALTRLSNAHFYMIRALARHVDHVDVVCPQTLAGGLLGASGGIRGVIHAMRSRPRTRLAELARFAACVERHLRTHGPYDIVFMPMASQLMSLLRIEFPIVYASDATFALIHNYLPSRCGLPTSEAERLHRCEQEALDRAELVTYPSHWAAASARATYRVSPAKISVIPWGANLDDEPTRSQACRPRANDVCHLLFVGSPWKSKGGPTALATVRRLRETGVPAELTICGADPGLVPKDRHVHVAGWLDKGNTSDRQLLYQYYERSHFLLFPSVAECYGHVACEANAFGVPVIARRTGGIPAIVKPGVNGDLIHPDCAGDEYARVIETLWRDSGRHSRMIIQSRDQYEQRLTWDAWASSLVRQMEQSAESRSSKLSAP